MVGAANLRRIGVEVDWSGHPDEQLVRALAEDPSALGPLYDRYGRLVYGLALAILANQEEAEDLTQEVFLTLCSGTTYDAARGSVGAFLTTLVRSRAIDRLRRRTRSVRLLRSQWESAPPLELPPTPLDRLATAQCSARVRQALGELPESERRVLEMAYYQGLTQAEIAEEIGAPLGSVKSWCRRGLIGLKRALGELVE
jgi:RNA polymerase sigma-70 factor (ECF subfamily)